MTRGRGDEAVRMNYWLVRQRFATLALGERLEAAPETLRQDMGGALRVRGRNGWIHSDPAGGYQLYLPACSSRSWRACKRALRGYARATVECYGSGVFAFDNLPTPREAAIRRALVGLDRRGHQTRLLRPPRGRRFTGARRGKDGRFAPAGGGSPWGGRDGRGRASGRLSAAWPAPIPGLPARPKSREGTRPKPIYGEGGFNKGASPPRRNRQPRYAQKIFRPEEEIYQVDCKIKHLGRASSRRRSAAEAARHADHGRI
jgi:hypothetical protein